MRRPFSGTLTTRNGLVHAIHARQSMPERENPLGFVTLCRRSYTKTPLDVPSKVPTCIWCIVGQAWPSDVSAQAITNPCAEIELNVEDQVPSMGEVIQRFATEPK